MNLSIRHLLIAGVALAVVVVGTATRSDAQALGWEGETGVFVTPLAYTAASETEKIHPVVGYHYLNAGSVIGDFHEASITVGFLKRFEMGYTHEFHTQGDDKSLSPLWQNGFEIFHGKAMLIPEKGKWIPTISVGFMARQNVRNVGNLKFTSDGGISATDSGKSNGDVYMVASKQISQLKAAPNHSDRRRPRYECRTVGHGWKRSRLESASLRLGRHTVQTAGRKLDHFRLRSCSAATSPGQLPQPEHSDHIDVCREVHTREVPLQSRRRGSADRGQRGAGNEPEGSSPGRRANLVGVLTRNVPGLASFRVHNPAPFLPAQFRHDIGREDGWYRGAGVSRLTSSSYGP